MNLIIAFHFIRILLLLSLVYFLKKFSVQQCVISNCVISTRFAQMLHRSMFNTWRMLENLSDIKNIIVWRFLYNWSIWKNYVSHIKRQLKLYITLHGTLQIWSYPSKKPASCINCFDSSDQIAGTKMTRRIKLSVGCILIQRKCIVC